MAIQSGPNMNINCPEPINKDRIVSKSASDKYRENWEKIFGDKASSTEEDKNKENTS